MRKRSRMSPASCSSSTTSATSSARSTRTSSPAFSPRPGAKMSPRGHEHALRLALPPQVPALLERGLARLRSGGAEPAVAAESSVPPGDLLTDRPGDGAGPPAALLSFPAGRPDPGFRNPREHGRDLARRSGVERRRQCVGDRRRAMMHGDPLPVHGAAAGARIEQMMGGAGGAEDAACALRCRKRAVGQRSGAAPARAISHGAPSWRGPSARCSPRSTRTCRKSCARSRSATRSVT